jgi:hypothetical protein
MDERRVQNFKPTHFKKKKDFKPSQSKELKKKYKTTYLIDYEDKASQLPPAGVTARPSGKSTARVGRSGCSPSPSPLLSEQEAKSKSHATHALDTPLSIYVELREVEGER